MDTNILMESGTNELEVLEFSLNGNSYGINVAKIKEIINYMPVTPVPNAHPSIEGIFMPRDTMITAIDLKNCLQLGSSEPGGLFIITNFNKLDIAFHVDSVLGITRVSWKEIIKPTATVNIQEAGVATGIIKINEKLIIILDFEKIVSDINPETGLKITVREAETIFLFSLRKIHLCLINLLLILFIRPGIRTLFQMRMDSLPGIRSVNTETQATLERKSVAWLLILRCPRWTATA